jgi:hypothetical protein
MAEPDRPDPERAFAREFSMARRLYHSVAGIIVVWPRQLPPDLEKQLREWADNEYGKRKKNGR